MHRLFGLCPFELYDKYVETLPRKKSKQSYRSKLNKLKEYIAGLPQPIIYSYKYDRTLVAGFLDWLFFEEDVSPRTRNNYRGWCGSLASFMIERGYIKENPITGIKVLPENEKLRKAISPQKLSQLESYLLRTNQKPFFLACAFIYYTMIRPAELVHIRLRDINLKKGSVFISREFSKNKKDGVVALNDHLISLMLELKVFDSPSDFYLFGTNKFRTSPVLQSSEIFRRHWKKVREALKWPPSLQFYSLKASGIRDLANESGIVEARDQARHSSVSITNEYLYDTHEVSQKAREFQGHLFSDTSKK